MNNLIKKINSKQSQICVIGLGYVGIPTALTFTKSGFKVLGIDTNETKIDNLNNGVSPIKDKFIIEHLNYALESKLFFAQSKYDDRIRECDIIILALPTPVLKSKTPDLTFIQNSMSELVNHLREDQLIILESTVYPGATDEIIGSMLINAGHEVPDQIGYAYCPERLNPGDDNHNIPDIVRVVSAVNTYWGKIADQLYSNIQKTFLVSDIKTAEMAKLIENTQRDLNVALVNEIALICERIEINVFEVLEAAKTKWNFLSFTPGPGVGGHCLPHDPYYLVTKAYETGYTPEIILAGRRLNDSMPFHVLSLLINGLNNLNKSLKSSSVLIMGATYKSNTDDYRSTPTETLVIELSKLTQSIAIFEPNVSMSNLFNVSNYQSFSINLLESYDAIIFMVKHDEFINLKTKMCEFLNSISKKLVIIDCINLFDNDDLFERKFGYIRLGDGKNRF